MWIPLKGAQALIKKLGGGKEGFQKALRQNPKLFENTGPRKTTALDPKTGKPKSGQKASKASTSKPAGKKGWDSLPANVRKKLEAGNTKGFTEAQLTKYRKLWKNKNH